MAQAASQTAESPSRTSVEIASQPECWRRTVALAGALGEALPRPGERTAVVGCGTSWFVAQSYAALREAAGQGETDAFAASEFPTGRRYDRVVTVTRSGTTTEVLTLLGQLRGTVPTTAITADPDTPVRGAADRLAVLEHADERSVVQTRFATSVLALLRAHTGEDLTDVVRDAQRALEAPLPPAALAAEQFTFLGRGWAYGLAQEAALKMREAAGAWTEAYPVMEYRHGPISITGPGRITWVLGEAPEGLAAEVARVGGTLISGAPATEGAPQTVAGSPTAALDPMADLVRAQRLAVALAEARGYDPDQPRNLSRSVILDQG